MAWMIAAVILVLVALAAMVLLVRKATRRSNVSAESSVRPERSEPEREAPDVAPSTVGGEAEGRRSVD